MVKLSSILLISVAALMMHFVMISAMPSPDPIAEPEPAPEPEILECLLNPVCLIYGLAGYVL